MIAVTGLIHSPRSPAPDRPRAEAARRLRRLLGCARNTASVPLATSPASSTPRRALSVMFSVMGDPSRIAVNDRSGSARNRSQPDPSAPPKSGRWLGRDNQSGSSEKRAARTPPGNINPPPVFAARPPHSSRGTRLCQPCAARGPCLPRPAQSALPATDHGGGSPANFLL